MDKNTNPFLNPEWINMQQQYIDALNSLKPDQGTPDLHGGNQHAWKQALDYWWKSIEKLLPQSENKSMFETLIRQTSAYYSIADEFSALLRDISATDSNSDDWQHIMANHFGKMKAGFDRNSVSIDPANASPFIWCQPLDSWRQALGSMSVLPEEFLEQLKAGNQDNLFNKLAATPGIGPTREYQEKLREAIRLWEIYQQHYKDYCSAFTELSKLALDRLEAKIIERGNTGRKITSLREIYNMWIDASEEVFADFAFNEDYAKLYGDLVNSLMAFKRHYDTMVDDILPLLNLPTRQSMQTVYKRQQQMRKQIHIANENQQQMADGMQQLKSDMQKLRKQMKPETASTQSKSGSPVKRKKTKT